MTGLRTAAAAVVGLVVGAVAMMLWQRGPASGTPVNVASSEASVEIPTLRPTPPGRREGVVLAWTPGQLPPGMERAVARLPSVTGVTQIRGGLVEMTSSQDADGNDVTAPPEGFVIPLDAMAFDPKTYQRFLPRSAMAVFARLRPNEVLLGETAAEIRALDVGATLRLSDGSELTVAATVDDSLVGASEIAVSAPALPDLPPRYLLVRYRGARAALEERIRATLPSRTPIRIRGPGETPYFRHGDAVLAPVMVKKAFGEFSYRPGESREFTQDSAWARDHIVTQTVPVLGRVTCHRGIMRALRGAMTDLRAEGLGWLVEPDSYAGCYNPRLTSSLDSVSRHAWGIALDINALTNRYGENGNQDRRLVATFRRRGFTWGGKWLIPDPAHFEYAQL